MGYSIKATEWDEAKGRVKKSHPNSVRLNNFIIKKLGARHTSADMAGDIVPIQMLQKPYQHSHVSTTIKYQSNFIRKDADEALDAVINKTTRQTPESKPD